MIKLKVIGKENYQYKLESNEGKEYELTLQFFDIKEEEIPNIGNYINISAELLNKQYKEYTSSLVFGGLKNICGRENVSINDIDLITLEVKDKEIVLKRLYG